jgi:hypothetical protein
MMTRKQAETMQRIADQHCCDSFLCGRDGGWFIELMVPYSQVFAGGVVSGVEGVYCFSFRDLRHALGY